MGAACNALRENSQRRLVYKIPCMVMALCRSRANALDADAEIAGATRTRGGEEVMICQRCAKDVTGNPIHTCNPSKLVRDLEAEVEALRKRIDRLDALEDWLADRVGPLVLIDDVYTALAAGRGE